MAHDVLYYRTVADERRLRALADHRQRFAVIGGGFIGSDSRSSRAGFPSDERSYAATVGSLKAQRGVAPRAHSSWTGAPASTDTSALAGQHTSGWPATQAVEDALVGFGEKGAPPPEAAPATSRREAHVLPDWSWSIYGFGPAEMVDGPTARQATQ